MPVVPHRVLILWGNIRANTSASGLFTKKKHSKGTSKVNTDFFFGLAIIFEINIAIMQMSAQHISCN